MSHENVEIVHPFTAIARQFRALNNEAEHVIGFLGRVENLDVRTDLDETFVAMSSRIAPLALGHVGDFTGISVVDDECGGDGVETGRWLDLRLSEPCIEKLENWFDQIDKNAQISEMRAKMAWVILSWLTDFTDLSDEENLRAVAKDRLSTLIRESRPSITHPAP